MGPGVRPANPKGVGSWVLWGEQPGQYTQVGGCIAYPDSGKRTPIAAGMRRLDAELTTPAALGA